MFPFQFNLLVEWSCTVQMSGAVHQPGGVQLNYSSGKECYEQCDDGLFIKENNWDGGWQ